MKRSFFQAAVTSILLYGCTTWTLTKRLEKKLDGNYTRMLRAILNKSWQQHPTRHQLYGHLPPITKSIQVRRTRHAGHCWRSRDELIRDVLLWIPTHGRAKAGRPARTYIQQLCEDTGCCPEDLPRAMNDREEWRERVRDIRAASTIWWWWWWDFKVQTDVQTTRPCHNQQQKTKTFRIVDFAIPAEHRVKLKESKKKDKYLDVDWELKKPWNMKVMVIPTVIDALDTVTKGLIQRIGDLEIRGKVETIQTTVLLRSARILRRVLETWEDSLALRLQWNTKTNPGGKYSQKLK